MTTAYMDKQISASLSKFIAAEHIKPSAIRQYADEIKYSEYQLLIIDNFLIGDQIASIKHFLQNESIFETYYRTADSKITVDKEVFLAASENNRFFKHNKLVGVKDGYEMSSNYLRYLRFQSAMLNDFCSYFAQFSNTAILPDQEQLDCKRFQFSDFNKKHHDDNGKRALCINIYFSPWIDTRGGELKMQKPNSHEILTIPPIENRCVIFEPKTQIPHWVEPVSEPDKDWYRHGCTLWYNHA